MLCPKMSFEICLGTVAVRAAVHAIAVPDVFQFEVSIALMLGPGVEVIKYFATRLTSRANVAENG